jgi:hypothetical protein
VERGGDLQREGGRGWWRRRLRRFQEEEEDEDLFKQKARRSWRHFSLNVCGRKNGEYRGPEFCSR